MESVIVLIGNGSHASDIIRDCSQRDGPSRDPRGLFRIFDHHSLVGQIRPDEQVFVIGINDPQTRAQVAEELGVKDRQWTHSDAIVQWSTAGHGTHINYGVTMTRTTIGHHCTVSPGVTICGDVTIGDRVLVGAGATICDRVTIGDDVTIGAGAVVLPKAVIPNGETWVGIPAHRV